MNKTLEFGVGNDSVFACPRKWVWAKDGVGLSAVYDRKEYPKRNDLFFSIGWQVNTRRSAPLGSTESNRIIHLWVESPRHEDNATLNGVKRELVKALMNSDLRRMMPVERICLRRTAPASIDFADAGVEDYQRVEGQT